MLPRLVKNFNGDSYMFTIGCDKEFVVNRNDVCNVFCLPMSDIPVPEPKKNGEDTSVDNCIIQAWRSDFDISNKQAIPLSKLKARMKALVNEVEEFKRYFVIHAMYSFLAPTTYRIALLKLLKAVEKVNEIKTFDWCSCVLKKLKKLLMTITMIQLLRMLVDVWCFCKFYIFIHLNFQGVKESCSIPLIRHWTNAKIKSRINLEIKAGGLGQGPLDTTTYPVLQSPISQSIVAIHELFLLLKRNMNVLSSVQANGFKTLSDLVSNVLSERTVHYLLSILLQFLKLNINVDVGGGVSENLPVRKVDDNDGGGVDENVPIREINDDGGGANENVRVSYKVVLERIIKSNKYLCSQNCGPLVPREDMASLAAPLRIRFCIIDCFALYLNDRACFESSGPRRFCFGARQSFALLYVCENIGQGNISSDVKDLHDLWKGWVSYENRECDIMDAELCDHLGAFLGKRNQPKYSQIPFYRFEIVNLEWRKACFSIPDSGNEVNVIDLLKVNSSYFSELLH
uniref:Uncharacterized protein n=1 Tax=Chenopodium quinoa TaxID=63459 RepID=A0A803ND59_CHEQI